MPGANVSARRRILGWLLAPLLATTCGCVSPVRLVKETADGGVVRMPTNTNRWPTFYRARAELLMRQKCPDGFHIDKEGAVGGNLDPHRAYESYFGYTGGSEAEQVYHIAFHGVAESASVPPPAAPSAQEKDELPPPRPLPLPETN